MEACDWRTKISKDLREKIVKRIIDILRKRSPSSEQSLSQLKKIQKVAENFEEKVYMDASDQKEYMRKIMVKLMAAEGSHPNVVPTSSSNAPYFGLKASNLVGNQGQSSAVQSTDQSQACEVPEKHLLPDVRNNMASAGVSANLASARITVSASAQVKQELIAPPCITWQQQVQQQQHHQHQQKLLKHTLQQTSQQSVIQTPLARSSEIHVPLSDRQLDQISSLEQTSESVIKNPLQTAFGQTNPQDTPEIRQTVSSAPEHQLMQSQKQQHLMGRRLTATNLQQNQLSGHPNSLRDWQQQHHRLPLQHNNLQQEFKGKNIILSSANNEDQRNNISVLHGSSQLPETQSTSSGKRPCEVKMQETRQTALALLSNQVLKSQPQSLERQLNFQAQPENMQNLLNSEKMQISGIPASTFEQRVSNIDNFQEEVYRKVEVLKSKYLTALTDIDQRVTSYFQKLNSVPQHPDRGNIKKLKAVKHMHCTVKFT
ncbi:hypothetical protein M0R45_019981 [Rubus argutus]|uniref:KIX domain-containing protein n=1 Tax=Rubus argutus TaxID=59490 RepID=A0AAW1X9E4_RUBAR